MAAVCAICSAQHLLPNQRFRLWEDLGRPTQLAIQLEALVGRDISQRLRASSRLCCRSYRADVKLKESFDKRQKELLTKIHSKLPGPAHRLPSLPEKRPLTSPVSHTGVSPLAKRHIPELPLTTPLRNSLTQTQEKGCGPANYSGRRQDTRQGVTLASSPSGRQQDTRQRVALASSPSGRQQDTRQGVTLASSPSGRRQDTRQGVTLASSPSGRRQDTRQGVTLASSPSGRRQDTRQGVTLASSPSGRWQDTRQGGSPSGRLQKISQPQVGKRVTLPHVQEVARRELFPASKSKRNPRVVATHQRPPMLLS